MTVHIASTLALLLSVASTVVAGGPSFRTGDIALIGGQTGAGQAVSAADPSRSGVGHCGIIVMRDNIAWFIHADVYTSRVIAERWVDYAPVRDNTDLYILLRHDDELAATRAAEIAWQFVEQRVPFDTAFDDNDSNKLYCTELVMVAYARASAVLAVPERMHVRMPFVSNRVVHPAGLMSAPGMREVTRSEGKGDQ